MRHIVSVHSFRGGTGKSNVVANLASLLAASGHKVGVIDTDIQSPGVHLIFGLETPDVQHSLNDYLRGHCSIREAAHDVTELVAKDLSGRIYVIPSSLTAGDIAQVMHEGYDVARLTDGFRQLLDELQLDFLIVDTHPGLNEETLLAIALSNVLVIVLRPDKQDYQGTSVAVQVARKLEAPRILLALNKVPLQLDANEVRDHVREIYECDVACVIPHSDEMMLLASEGVFALSHPDHPVTNAIRRLAEACSGAPVRSQ